MDEDRQIGAGGRFSKRSELRYVRKPSVAKNGRSMLIRHHSTAVSSLTADLKTGQQLRFVEKQGDQGLIEWLRHDGE